MTGENRERLQREIAALAARRMAEFGDECAQAKRKAAADYLGDARGAQRALPDDEQVADALREHLRTFEADEHPARIEALRRRALAWMERLAQFEPHLVGAVLNGSATRYSALQLQLFAESAKDVEMQLLTQDVSFRVEAPEDPRSHALEVIGFHDLPLVQARTDRALGGAGGRGTLPLRVVLTVFDPRGLRVAPKGKLRSRDQRLHPIERSGRASLGMVRELLAGPMRSNDEPDEGVN
jgi:hypothetical protein